VNEGFMGVKAFRHFRYRAVLSRSRARKKRLGDPRCLRFFCHHPAVSWQENENKICTELTFPLIHHHAVLTSTSREQGEQEVSRATLTLGSP
jgi:hypothetical protein